MRIVEMVMRGAQIPAERVHENRKSRVSQVRSMRGDL
jgi:hypothetical protein